MNNSSPDSDCNSLEVDAGERADTLTPIRFLTYKFKEAKKCVLRRTANSTGLAKGNEPLDQRRKKHAE